jgi:hypothetical protein
MKKRKYYKPTKKQMASAVQIDEATLNVVTNRIGVIATCLEAVAAELDDLNDYQHCVIPTRKGRNGEPLEFHSIIPPTLSNTLKNTMAQMDKVIAPLLGKNDKTMFQALKVSELFTGAINEVNNRYTEAQVQDRQKLATLLKDGVVCKSCGEFHHGEATEKVKPVKGECVVCGDTNVDVYPARVYNYCGYNVEQENK